MTEQASDLLGRTILVVEDEAMVREIVVLELMDAGFRVREAEDGVEAVRLIEAGEPFDALLTDIRLPGGIDGLAVAEVARRARPTLPVIYASGFSPDPLRLVPGGRLFAKPVGMAAVVAALADLGVAP